MRIRLQDDAPRTSPQPPHATGRSTRTAALLGLLGFVVSFAGSWQPSFWGDEAASVMSAQRPLPSLFRMLGNVDAVHGAYYLFLHYWIGLFGASELSVRLPSAIAVGAATAGTFVLARALLGGRVALIAALIFAILPRVTYLGAEARSYALATAAAVWSAALLVRALRPGASGAADSVSTSSGIPSSGTAPRASLWAGYAAILGAGIILFADVILILPAHALAVLLLPGTVAIRRHSVAPWCLATAAALVMAAPVLFWGFAQREQISFIQRRPPPGLRETAVVQWFGTVPLAILACALMLLAVISALARRRGSAASPPNWRALAVLLTWLLVPTVLLVVATYLGAALYSARYLSFATPAVAIAMAVGVASLRAWWLQASVVLLAVALALPTYLSQRGEFSKNRGSDWRQASEVLRADARPGDAVLFDENGRPSRKPRLALHLYPEAFQGLTDVRLARPYQSTDGLWDATVPLAAAVDRLAGTSRVWLLLRVGGAESRGSTSIPTLEQLGFRVAESTTLRRTVVIEMTR